MSFRMLSCVVFKKMKLCLIQEDKIVLCAPFITLSMIALNIIWSLFLLVIICYVGFKKKSLHFLHLSIVLLLHFLHL
jgi:hypothetical protein